MRDFQKPERSETFSSNGMIATSHPLAAKVGLDAMVRGGNAIDKNNVFDAGLWEQSMVIWRCLR